MKAWLDSWHNQLLGFGALVVLVGGFILAPESKLDRLGHLLTALASSTGGQMIGAALAALVVAVLRWALARVPGGKGGAQ